MESNLLSALEIGFIAITALTILFFYFSNGKNNLVTGLIILWSIAQAYVASTGFYENTTAFPPRFILVILPTTLAFIYAFRAKQLQYIIEKRNIYTSTFLHIVRIPVEYTLYYLFVVELVPELMTYEGRNFDILAGITAPIVGILFMKKYLSANGLLIWNYICLALVSFILINGILSAELPFQQFAFDQPNKAVTLYPFILLPATVVPIVIFTHITDIIKLRRSMQ